MKIAIRILFSVAAGAVLLLAPTALADTASMDLTGVGPNGAMAGVYVGPYVAKVNGVTTPVVCDDFADESYLNETWTADITTLANLTGTKWGGLSNATTLYEEAAWLTEKLESDPSDPGDIQFAIWALFDPSAVNGLSSADQAVVENLITQAEGQTFTTGEFSNILIYTADTSDPILCNGRSCANTPPQEFLVYTPEPGELAFLLTGFCAIALGTRRRRSSNRRILSLA